MIKLIKQTYHLRCWKELALLLVLSCFAGFSMAQSTVDWSNFEKDLTGLEQHLFDLGHDTNVSGDELSEVLRSGYEYFLKNQNIEGQALVLYRMGVLYGRENMLSAAIDVHELALGMYHELNVSRKQAQVKMMMGTHYGRRGDYDQATSYLLEALKLFEQLDDGQGRADVLLKLGTVQSYLGNYDQALDYYFAALELSENNLKENMVTLYGNIGFIYMDRGDFEQSESYFRKALDHGNENESLRPRTLALINLGQMYKLKGDPVLSEQYLAQALQWAEEGNMLEEQVGISLITIDESTRAGQQKSLDKLSVLNERAAEMEMRYMQLEIMSKMISLSKNLGLFERAVELIEAREIINKQLYDERKERDIANLQASYELDRFKQENDNLNEKVSAERRRGFFILFSTAILAVGLFVAMYFFMRAQRTNKLLKERERELSQSNLIKDKLFSIIGHDLKNALSTQPMVLELIRDTERGTPEYRKLWNGLEASVHEVLFVLDTLLNWGQMQIRGVDTQPVSFRVGEVLDNSVRLVNLSAGLKKVRIINKVPADLEVQADKNQFRFVIRNLLSNALKYSLEGGEIEIGMKVVRDESAGGSEDTAFYVKDSGVGIDPNELENIFDPDQESVPGTSNEQGHGIALALSRQFIQKHGGRIWVESERDKGTTFYFTCGDGTKTG